MSYPRFVGLIPSVVVPLCAYLEQCRGRCSGLSFVDSTPLAVCHNRRITRHKVFAGLAQRGKNSMGWFYGFKLHVIVNDQGELLAYRLTAGNLDDRQPLPQMARGIIGKLFGDKGYLSQPLVADLLQQGLHLVTAVRKNMANRLMLLADKLFLRKRAILETIQDQFKDISQIEHSRHRSWANFLVNVVAGLIRLLPPTQETVASPVGKTACLGKCVDIHNWGYEGTCRRPGKSRLADKRAVYYTPSR